MRATLRGRRGPSLPTLLLVLLLPLLLLVGACGRGAPEEPPRLRVAAVHVAAGPADPGDLDASGTWESGEPVSWRVPVEGASGADRWRVEVVAGALPRGISASDRGPSLEGVLLEAGRFAFTLRLLDLGTEPFGEASAHLEWEVPVGAVRIVGTDPPGGLDELRPATYGEFTARTFRVAGGVPPYECRIVEDPASPDDGALPLGTAVLPRSCTVLGAPIEIRPGGRPFRFTVEARDARGSRGRRAFGWRVEAPRLRLLPGDLEDGTCGTEWRAHVTVLGGVPPFVFELVRAEPPRDGEGRPAVSWREEEGVVADPPEALLRVSAADYPAASDPGPDYTARCVPPEGLRLAEEAAPGAPAGTVEGVPRRRGAFRWVLHARSASLPHDPGQHDWLERRASFAEAPPLALDPALALGGTLRTSPPWSRLPEPEVGQPWNPDAGTHPPPGLRLLVAGGVPKDGWTDAPHAGEARRVLGDGPEGEERGSCDWTVDWDPEGSGAVPPPGIELDGRTGVLRTQDPSGTGLVRSRPRAVRLVATDQQLPEPHVASCTVSFSVGPDRVVVTESGTSSTVRRGTSLALNDPAATVRVLDPGRVVSLVRDLAGEDLSPTHEVPATAGLAPDAIGALLTEVDFARVTVNPTGWWDDVHALNPEAARPGQHGDPNRESAGCGPTCQAQPWRDWQPAVTAVELPPCRAPAVAHDPARGVYADGGRLYAFTSAERFGLFVLRSDATLYVPCAFERADFGGFGDGPFPESAPSHSLAHGVSLTVSPDGRFAAAKLRAAASATSPLETASASRVVVVSLAGEKAFPGGRTWTVLGTGASGDASTGTWLYGASLALTNRHLYWLCGGSTGADAAWRGHFAYRWEVAGPDGGVTATAPAGALLPPAAPNAAWANAPGRPLQTPFHRFGASSASAVLEGATVEVPTDEAFLHDGANLLESSIAPVPFRVSRDGTTLALLASADPGTSSGPDVMTHHVWVDREGGGVRQVSTARRHAPGGAGRGASLGRGPDAYGHWAKHTGPTTRFEVSDDGTAVAVVVNRAAGTVSSTTPAAWYRAREDVVAFRTTDGWATSTEVQVTGAESGAAPVFSSRQGALWRFGALAFTRDGRGLVFWGGLSQYHATSQGPVSQASYQYGGSVWGCDLASSPVTVVNLLAAADGGATVGVASFTSASPYDPVLPAGSSSYANGHVSGVLKPVGGFLSGSREMYYLASLGALDASDPTSLALVRVNVRSVDPSRSIAGLADFRAGRVGAWPSRRGFLPGRAAVAGDPIDAVRWSAPGRVQGFGLQVASSAAPWVAFASHHAPNGPARGGGSSSGGPYHPSWWGDEGALGGELDLFHADLGGPVQRLTSFGADGAARSVHVLEPGPTGGEVAFVYDTAVGGTGPAYEHVGLVAGIELDASGALARPPLALVLEEGEGRAGESMAFGSFGDRLWYAFGREAADENRKELVEVVVHAETGTFTRRVVAATPRRWNVLGAGR